MLTISSICGWTTWTVIALCPMYIIIMTYKQLVYWKHRGVPHGFDLPFFHGIGDLFFTGKSFPQFVNDLYYRFPATRYYGTRNLGKPVIILRDIDLIRQISTTHFDCFTDRQCFLDPTADPLFERNLLSLKGQRWKDMRSALSTSFTCNKMNIMFHLVSQCSKDFVDYFKKHPKAAELIDMKDVFTRYTNDVIATTAFGLQVNSLENKENEFFLLLKSIGTQSVIFGMVKFITGALSPSLFRFLGMSYLPGKASKFLRKIITETVKTRDKQGIIRPDLMQLLMNSRNKEEIDLTIDDIVSHSVLFFLVGVDNSSTLMAYIAYELGYNLDIQEKLRKEVDECLSSDEEITYDILSKMKYMDMVINEALRKYPPIPIIDRICSSPYKLPPALPDYPDYVAEVGTLINIPVYSIHHDPTFFPDPEKFDPERFSEENKHNIDPCTYIPFGTGPRKCIANRFAMMEIKVLISDILRNFEIERSEKTPYPVIFAPNSFNILAKDGIWTRFKERNKNN